MLNWPSFPQRTIRRRWLDTMLDSVREEFAGDVIDLGGKRHRPRGNFQPPLAQVRSWRYVNIAIETQPDVVADLGHLPFRSACRDVVICTEVIEHLREPEQAMAEIWRILRPGGKVFASIPFLCCVHGDPVDFQRYTPEGIRRLFGSFGDVIVVPMGGFWAVVEMTFHYGAEYWPSHGRLRQGLARRLFALFATLVGKFEKGPGTGTPHSVLADRFTTGYWVRARRP